MIVVALLFAILLFSILTDQVQEQWPHSVFRAVTCLTCALILLIRGSRRQLRWNLVALAFLLPAFWGVIQLVLSSSVWPFATWNALLRWFALWALFLATLQLPTLRSHLRVFAWFGGAFSIFAVAQFLLWRGPGEPMMATFFNHNHYAALMELLLPVALWRWFRDTSKLPLALCALAMVASVAISGSRAGILLLLAEFCYVGLRAYRKPIFVAVGTLVIAVVSAGIMWTRFEKLATSEPYESRAATAQASVRMLRDRPQLGYGLGTWANVFPAYAERDTGFRLLHADNDWLEWSAEGGLPFLAIMLAIAAFATNAAWQEPWCIGCLAVLLHSLVEFPLQKQSIWACFVVLLATAQTERNSDKALRKQAS